jgi:hypothetical protein
MPRGGQFSRAVDTTGHKTVGELFRPNLHRARLWRVADLLGTVGRVEKAITWWQRAAETGNTHALGRAAELLEKTGRTDEMQRLRQYGIEPGGSIAERWGPADEENRGPW